MQIKDFLESVCKEIKYKPIRKEIGQELENHVEEAKEDYIHKGESEAVAMDKAIADMGDAEILGKTLNKIHRPRLDYKLLILFLILLCFTFLVAGIKTSSHVFSEGEGPFFIKTITFLIIGFMLGLVVYFMDYTKMIKYSNYIGDAREFDGTEKSSIDMTRHKAIKKVYPASYFVDTEEENG